ncbi:MAG: aminotransferase class I/II-fold pyridoxal phosphate-dependent enzyme [Saprospiraceae bacterium]|nr:aminotransferase class I/II-fold pyridoxal phosphate-dependent enzyme [Saprospiraceae bacterium]
MQHIPSKISSQQTTIFTEMSALSAQYNAINLGQGFPNFEPPKPLLELVNFYLNNAKNQYAPMAGVMALREAISLKILTSYNRYVHPDHEITITAGATQAIFTAITALIHDGDEVIIFEPAYDSYRPAIEIAGGKVVVYAMEAPEFKINWSLVGAMITPMTKMILINTPHNPTGTIFKSDDLQKLSQIVKDTDIIILSDEVYEHLIFEGHRHESILNYSELYERSIAVFSFGKTFHCTGWKVGYCVAPSYLMHEFRNIHQWNVFSVNSFIQHALSDFLKESSHYDGLPDFYQKKRDYFKNRMAGSKFQFLKSEGTFFQLCDYSNISDMEDGAFTKELTVKHGVASIPLSVFYTEKQQNRLIRFCFAKTDDLLSSAAEILRSI